MILVVKSLCPTWEMNLKFYEFIYSWVLHIENERGSLIFKVGWLMGWNILEQIFQFFVLPTHCCNHRIKEVNIVPVVYTILTIKPISILLLNVPDKTEGYTIPIPTVLRLFQMFWLILCRDGDGMVRGQIMGSSPLPHMDFSCSISAPPHMMGKISCPIPTS